MTRSVCGKPEGIKRAEDILGILRQELEIHRVGAGNRYIHAGFNPVPYLSVGTGLRVSGKLCRVKDDGAEPGSSLLHRGSIKVHIHRGAGLCRLCADLDGRLLRRLRTAPPLREEVRGGIGVVDTSKRAAAPKEWRGRSESTLLAGNKKLPRIPARQLNKAVGK